MTLNKYQKLALKTDMNSAPDYYYYGLLSEAGELAAIRKRMLRGDKEVGDLKGEFGDIFWYLAVAADYAGYTLEEIAAYNLDKLEDRFNRGVIRGQGDER